MVNIHIVAQNLSGHSHILAQHLSGQFMNSSTTLILASVHTADKIGQHTHHSTTWQIFSQQVNI
jgi:hypothetical protein